MKTSIIITIWILYGILTYFASKRKEITGKDFFTAWRVALIFMAISAL